MEASGFYDDQHHENGGAALSNGNSNNKDHGWQKVTNSKKTKRQEAARSKSGAAGSAPVSSSNGSESRVFQALEKEAEQKRANREALLRAFHEEHAASASPAAARSDSDADEDSDEHPPATDDQQGEKKPKAKKPKKPKVSVSEAASAIDESHLGSFLAEISESYADRPDIQLMRFADYFGRAFSQVTPSQFGWNKTLKETPISKVIEIPLCYLSETVIKTASDWLSSKPSDAVGNFVVWGLTDIVSDMQPHINGQKGSKGAPPPSKTKVGVLAVVSIALRKRPEVLIQKASVLRTSPQFQGQEKLSMLSWTYGQLVQADLVAGMHIWVQNFLPLACGKSSTPASRDAALQFAESLLFSNLKKARPILQNGASRKGERLVPAPALHSLMHAAFPSPASRTKATERFEAIYPVIKELALHGPHRSKATRPVAQQLLPLCLESACEDIPALAHEACDLFVWCLSENSDCYKQWEKLHLEKLKGSIKVLNYISDEWRVVSGRLRLLDEFNHAIGVIRTKTTAAMENAKSDPKLEMMLKVAEKHAKVLSKRSARTGACFKTMATLLAGAGIAYGFYLLNFDIPLLR